MIYLLENSLQYSLIECYKSIMQPFNSSFMIGENISKHKMNPTSHSYLGRSVSGIYEIAERLTRIYRKPSFNIQRIFMNERYIDIEEKILIKNTFCHLIHFRKMMRSIKQPKLLIVAPLSGHYATLLREMVETMLPFFDVYITEWIDARQIPISEGKFDLNNYIDYIIEFLKFMGSSVNVIGVCQSSVPILAAVSILSERNKSYTPASMTLLGGPIDIQHHNNSFMINTSVDWFESSLISRVPFGYPGYARAVYPGTYQIFKLIMMNLTKHVDSHAKLYQTIVEGNDCKANYQRKFYDEYFAVMDIPAEFYLQTNQKIYTENSLIRKKFKYKENIVDLSNIDKTALLVVEGEFDDISGIGQTKAALNLCKNVKNKKYHLQKNVGHYGIFSGHNYREEVLPIIVKFINKYGKSR